jgi:hypothetical protein
MVHAQEGYPIVCLCRLLDLPRSSYYYRPVEKDESELQAGHRERGRLVPDLW